MTNRTRTSARGIAAALIASGALFLAACTSTSGHWQGTATAGDGALAGSSSSPSTTPGTVTVTPAANSTNVAPNTPVMVTASGDGKLTDVTVTAGSAKIKGTLSDDGKTWTSTTALKFDTKYIVKAAGTNLAASETTSTFTTVDPKTTVTPHLIANALSALNDGATYGVGEPIMVHFAHSIPSSQRDAIVNALSVETTPHVDGRWHWINSQQVDYRGEDYWPTGTTISISAKLFGVRLADGVYGGGNASATIHIGDKHIAIADNKTHMMKVYVNDKLVRTVPVSMGMGGSTRGAQGQLVNYWTRSGPHVVIVKSPTVTMSSASYGITDPKSPFYYAPETVRDAVRISYSGEFVHLRTWTVGDIGVRNTSHGCINVGAANAGYMYGLLRTGDIVDVTGTPVKVSFDNTVADWAVPWSQWN
ncbi:MAG TPA: Ig-like domain-containing protein [Micromonosporaceae bacterium]